MIEVLYKDYHKVHGQQILKLSEFEVWQEEGNYTSFYKEYPFNKEPQVTITIPTHAICWIKTKGTPNETR
jgi:hypothetical protein